MANKYQVWECKIYVPVNSELPNGFDSPPRSTAIRVIVDAGLEVAACFSGWGGRSTTEEEESIGELAGDIYIAGFMDMDPEGNA